MTELSTEARAILEAGQAGLSPSAATKASVLSAVEGNIAGAASTTALAASATAASGASFKIVLALVLAVGVGGGIWVARSGTSSSPAINSESALSTNLSATNSKNGPLSTNTRANEKDPDHAISDNHEKSQEDKSIGAEKSTATESVVSTAVASAEPVGDEPAKTTAKQIAAKIDQPLSSASKRSAQADRKTKPAKPALEPEPVRSTLADEQKLIAAAQVAIRKADYSEALSLLKNHKSQFPKGILAPERNAASAIAGCLSEQRGSKAAGRRFLTNHAHSPLAGRVRGSCKLP